jgi:hypothetical protein
MAQVGALALCGSILTAVNASPLTAFRDHKYAELVKHPDVARRDAEWRAYLQGIATTIRWRYVCSDSEERELRDPDLLIDALVTFSKTALGDFYLTPKGGIGNMIYETESGDVLFRLYTLHSHCTPMPAEQPWGPAK